MKSPSLAQKSRSLVPLARFGLFFGILSAGAAALPVASTSLFPESPAPIVGAASLGDLEVQWKGKAHSLADLESKLEDAQSPGVLAKLHEYADWILENEYMVALSKDARVILVTPSKRDNKRCLKLVEETLKSFDGLMAPPERGSTREATVDSSEDAGDGDDIFADAFGPVDIGDEGLHVPDSEPVMVFEVSKEEQYRELLTGVGNDHPRMEDWARSVASEPGFAEEQLAAAAWQAAPDGFELGDVWRPENELVNRLARLLLHRSYGVQPTWLRVATAWRVEMEVQGDIYCFPYRKEFVGIGDHGGWSPNIKTQFKKRKKDPLKPEEFATWQRNTWDEDKAHLSWGVVEYLAKHKPESLPAIAEEFRLLFNSGFRTTFGDGTWKTDPRYEVPVEKQTEVLQSHAGEDFLEETSEFFRKWKSYKPKKKKRR